VIGAQPKDPGVDRMFQIGLGIGIVVCLGVFFGLMAIEKRLIRRA
jgi:hypothetical protein